MKDDDLGMGVLVVAFLVAVGVALHTSHWAFTKIDTRRVCAAEQLRDCLQRSPATVVDSDTVRDETGEADVAVALDLERGERVYLESWNDRLVSVFEPGSGHRAHTPGWPGRIRDQDFAAALGISSIFGALIAASAVAACADRKRG